VFPGKKLIMAMVACLLPAAAATGTILAQGDLTQNTSSPANFNYWNNIGYLPAGNSLWGSGIYLGGGWVLTAWHVQGDNNSGYSFTIPGLNNGQNAVFTPVTASQVQLPYSVGGPGSDLALFRLEDDPLLRTLPNVRFGATPQVGTDVTITGAGWNWDPTLHYWRLSDTAHPNTATWTDVTGQPTQILAQRKGYLYGPTGFAKRWGTNTTVAMPGNGPTFTFTAQDDNGNVTSVTELFGAAFQNAPGNVQVAPGDSGGGVFVGNRLVGLNLYKGDDTKDPKNPNNVGQPENTAVFGNASYFADLAHYVDEIASITKLHPSMDGDANLDGLVDIEDFKALYASYGTAAGWTHGDFNLDGVVDFGDYQALELNYGLTSDGTSVDVGPLPAIVAAAPEPGGAVLVGLGTAAVLRRRSRRC
jgi:hypothetical protein